MTKKNDAQDEVAQRRESLGIRALHVDPTLRAAVADLNAGLNALKARASIAVGDERDRLMNAVDATEAEIGTIVERLRHDAIVAENRHAVNLSGPA